MTRIRSVIGTSLALLLAVTAVCAAPAIVTAAQSSNFMMDEVGPGNAAGVTHGSTNFQMQGDLSWRQESPLRGQSFQITKDPPVIASSTSSTQSSTATSTGNGGGNGGHPGTTSSRPPVVRPTSSSSSSATSASSVSSLSSSSFSSSEGLRPAAPEAPQSSSAHSGGMTYECPAILCAAPFWHPIVLVPVPVVDAFVACADIPPLLLILLLVFILGALVASTMKSQKQKQRTHNRVARIFWFAALIVTGVLLMLLLCIQTAQAAVTSPERHVYNGHLLNASGQAITTPHSIRFSEWYSRDMQATDVAAGVINTLSTSYAGYQEVHVVTPDSQGYFSVILGTGAALPNLATTATSNLDNLFLQVEVKASGNPDTAYEMLDTNPADDLVDRSPILSVPFAQNADLLDQREVGTGSGSIPLLQSGGLLPVSAIPGGTNQNTFIVDSDNTAASQIVLQFGAALAETLKYDILNDKFVFSSDLEVQGDLVVTGLINGIDISAIASSDDGKLRVSSGAGLTINVTGGSYRINGNVTDYAGASAVAVAANATNYVFIGSGGLTVRTMPFPTDESFIRLAEVVTNGASVTQINDRRIVQSDDREEDTEVNLHAEFPNASYQGDAIDNVGQLSVSLDSITQRNFYLWTSTRTTLQDYDVAVRVSLPADFARWGTTPLTAAYRTTSADNTKSKVDISVFDTNGVPVSLSGSATGLASTSWATTALTYSGTPTWTPGSEFLVKFKLSSKDSFQAHVGSLKLLYIRLTP